MLGGGGVISAILKECGLDLGGVGDTRVSLVSFLFTSSCEPYNLAKNSRCEEGGLT